MGRYLANGVMTKFIIKKRDTMWRDKDFSIETEKENILKEIDKMVDTSLYELTDKKEECYEFSLKPEIFNNNIHELIREISVLTFPNGNGFYELKKENFDLESESFSEEYPIVCKKNEEGEYVYEVNGETENVNWSFCPLYWLMNEERLFYNVRIDATVLLLWLDCDKYDGEDATYMLRIINNMKSKYYTSKLSKALIYCVAG